MLYTATCTSPLGMITLAADSDRLVGLWLEGQKYFGEALRGIPTGKGDLPIFAAAKDWLNRYFAGERPAITELPLAPAGSAFRQDVWRILCDIPYGETTTYGAIAREMAARKNRQSMSSQAVGSALGHNPISIIIPCHRVVGTNGSLTGYAGGLETKIRLLELEGVDVSRFHCPA